MFILGGPDKYKYSPPRFMVDPQPELEELYSTVLGKEWREQAAVENLARAMSGHQLIESCTAAAVYRDVYEKPAPWQGPRDVLENMQALGQIESFNDWLKLFPVTPGNEIYIQRGVWNKSQHQVRLEQFARRTLRPLAEELAKKFWTTTQPQLLLLGFPRMVKPQAKGFCEERLTALNDIYQEALLLKAKIQAAPDHYSIRWVERGVEFDRTSMKTLGGAEGRRIVGWCVSPSVSYRHLVDTVPRTVCDAKVFSHAVEDF